MSQSIEDKVVNHLCAKYFLVDVFDKSFVDCSIATRKNKGTHYGIKLLKKYLRAISNKYDNFYVLKFDIKKYFYNMDHEIIKKLMNEKIKDKDTLNLLNYIINSTDQDYVNECIRNIKRVEIDKVLKMALKEKDKQQQIKELQDLPEYKKGKGFPIGNMSSQIFAIIYLNELDHYIKEKLRIKYYIRYMDDGILLHHDKKYLEYCLNEIKQILNKYQLELNENKTKINGIKNGIDFLGFRFYMKKKYILMKLRNNTKKRFKIKCKKMKKLLVEGQITKKDYDNAMASYKGHLKWGSCDNLLYSNLIK